MLDQVNNALEQLPFGSATIPATISPFHARWSAEKSIKINRDEPLFSAPVMTVSTMNIAQMRV
jgi:hypothetical protein